VLDPPGQQSEAHWNEEAKALLSGLIMFSVAHEEADRRTLATVREYLTLPPEKFRALLELMQETDAAGGLIARAANRFLGKSDREAASVMSSAQRHTHFLDSLRISERPDSDFTKSRTAVSVSPGQFGDGWSLVCCHASSVKISGFSVGVNPGFSLFRRILSPFSSMRCALWMMRSRMASAMVGSPII
jgi:hypothetical protein